MSKLMEIARRQAMAFHSDEEGLNVVEMVLLLAVAGIIMVGVVHWVKPNVFQIVADKVKDVIGTAAPW